MAVLDALSRGFLAGFTVLGFLLVVFAGLLPLARVVGMIAGLFRVVEKEDDEQTDDAD